jgi:alpha-L-fucosidase
MTNEAEQKYLALVDKVVAQGPYRADWDSLGQSRQPDWFLEQRLGIFMHWGLYSVPACANEWYSRNMYIKGMPAYEHHIKTYGPQSEFGYKDFIPLFKAEKFDPKEWISLFKQAGAGYICPVAEHHDGFQMYESELSHWNAKEMGPHRDVIGELKNAAELAGLVFCTSSHRAEHWFFMGHGKEFDSDVKEPMQKGDFYWPAMPEPDNQDLFSEPYPTEEYLDDWLARTAEIIVKYRPKFLYFDWWLQHDAFKPYLKKLAAFYYNCGVEWGTDVQICYKHDAMMFGSGIVEVERGGFAEAKPYRWQTDTAVAHNSWCYTDSLDYKTSEEIIQTFVDVVSKNGNLLLNIGPKSDGTIPDGDRKILEDIGAWMQVNREAVTGVKSWRKAMEGAVRCTEGQFSDGQELAYTSKDYRFTAGHGNIYACCMKCPEDGQFLVESLKDSIDQNVPEFHGIIEKADVLGFTGKTDWSVDKSGLHVSAPGLHSEFPVVVRVKIK